jgi:hypothetical protein
MEITSWQRQIIYGTMLGSGYLVRSRRKEGATPTYYMGISESRDPQWLLYKGAELQVVAARKPLVESRGVLKWRSVTSEDWQEIKKRFYDDDWNKTVDMETLDTLRDIGLATWFGDKGFWYTSRRIGLRTSHFGLANDVIASYFNEVEMTCEVKADSNGACRVVFDRKGTIKFLSTIGHRLPPCLQHRLDSQKAMSESSNHPD